MLKLSATFFAVMALLLPSCVGAQTGGGAARGVVPAPDRRADEGEGPFTRLIIRGATVIDGTGAPPIGPVDIVIEQNRIVEVRSVGYPKVAIRDSLRPTGAVKEIEASGMYVLPGFVDCHAHIGGVAQGTPAEYVYKLWLAHGVTTIREPGSFNGLDWTLRERERSSRNEIVAPRIFAYVGPGLGWSKGPLRSPELAREFVLWAKQKGVDGFKIIGDGPIYDPEIMKSFLETANAEGLGSTTHLAQMGVARMNILKAARLGLRSMEHWYGLPESLFTERTIQDYPLDYNYNDESHRFGEAGRLWKQAAPPGSRKWNEVMDELIRLNFTLDPTLTIYEASRDLMRTMNADWHSRYTLPSLWKFYQPSREAHGSYWFNWTTSDEVEWKRNYQLWMAFINEYPFVLILPIMMQKMSIKESILTIVSCLTTILLASLPWFSGVLFGDMSAIAGYISVLSFYNGTYFNGVILYLFRFSFEALAIQEWWLLAPKAVTIVRLCSIIGMSVLARIKHYALPFSLFLVLCIAVCISPKVHTWYLIPIMFLGSMYSIESLPILSGIMMLTYGMYAIDPAVESMFFEIILWMIMSITIFLEYKGALQIFNGGQSKVLT